MKVAKVKVWLIYKSEEILLRGAFILDILLNSLQIIYETKYYKIMQHDKLYFLST